MLEAQASGKRLAYSSEWFRGRQYLEYNNPEAEKDFITGSLEWTGTVLDFSSDAILEGITLKPDGEIADVKVRLTPVEGFHLPRESGYVRNFDSIYTKTLAHMWGIENPQDNLPSYACLDLEPSGFRPVLRSYGPFGDRERGRVGAGADCDGAAWLFAARFVSETNPVEIVGAK